MKANKIRSGAAAASRPPNDEFRVRVSQSSAKIDLRIGKEKATFGSTCGVKQGDNLAPILFIVFMNCVAAFLSVVIIFTNSSLIGTRMASKSLR